MATIKTSVKQHSVLLYFLLTFILSWGSILTITGPKGLPLTPEQAAQVGPIIYMAMLIGPSVAGLLLIGLVDGRGGLLQRWARLGRWRVGLRWYGVALLTAPLSVAVAVLLLLPFSTEYMPAIVTTDDWVSLLLTSIAAGVMVALFEEIGWTGLAVPQLRRRYGLYATALIVGLVWGVWHFPPFWEADSFAGGLPLLLLLARLFSWLPAYRVLMVWVYDQTESLLVVMLMHASLVAAQFTLFPMALAGTTALIAILTWAVVLWIVAVAVANLGQSTRKVRYQEMKAVDH
ncbi:MAG: CPBP family intramembrane metalloprotease [Caldilineaceae bacterium]|nr:CPBP family intramembrane metalloprotease [Caldilineaceae bacterium]